MPVEILDSDLTAPLDVVFAALEAGQDSDIVSFALRNPGPQDLVDLLLVIQVESLTQPGLYLSTGLPPQDELWARVRLTGQDASAAPAQQDVSTDWTPIGAWAALLIASLHAGGVRFGEIKMRPPSSATAVTYRWALTVLEAEHSRALPPALATACQGVLPHVGDRGASLLLRGLAVTPSAPPAEQIHISGGAAIVQGALRTLLPTAITFDQLDGNAAALSPGESYWATLSAPSVPPSVTVTKGIKAISPHPPAPPPGEALLEHILVRRRGGPSMIEAVDIAGVLTYGRHLVEPGAGLQAVVHAGQAIAGGTWRYWSARQVVPLVASATNYLWQLASGELDVTQSTEPPETTVLGPLWEIDTDAAGVVELRDLRTYTRSPVVLCLRGSLPAAPGEIASQLVHEALAVEAIVYRLSDNGGGASGRTVLDLEISGATVYSSQATDDQRPAWPFDAAGAELVDNDGIHELVELGRGDVLTLLSVEHPVGGTPAWAEAYLICWPR
jgi:hypothetical protein